MNWVGALLGGVGLLVGVGLGLAIGALLRRGQHVSLDHDEVGPFAGLERSDPIDEARGFCAAPRRGLQHLVSLVSPG